MLVASSDTKAQTANESLNAAKWAVIDPLSVRRLLWQN